MKSIDTRGLSCPEPVMLTRRALAELDGGQDLEVLVETVTSRENVLRTVSSIGCEAQVEEIEDGFRLVIHKPRV